jgi:dTMP kinase
MPDLTVMLDIPVEVGMARARRRRGAAAPDRFEGENLDFHQKLRDAYLAIAAEEPQRCAVIDAGAGREAVAREIWNVVGARLNPVVAPLGSNVRQEVGA